MCVERNTFMSPKKKGDSYTEYCLSFALVFLMNSTSSTTSAILVRWLYKALAR